MTRPGPTIRVWNVGYRRGRANPWYVRWSVNGTERGPKTFPTEDEALDYQARLRIAARDGLKWDLHTGLPVAWNPTSTLDVATFCRLYWARRTRGLKPRSAVALGETFSRFVFATMPARAPGMPGSFAELARWIQGSDVSKETETWLARWSPPMASLGEKDLERAHDALLVGVDGELLGARVVRRRFHDAAAVIDYAVIEGVLATNELKPPTGVELSQRPAAPNREYPTMDEMLTLVEAVESHQPASRIYRALTAVGVLAGCRPSEIVALERSDVELPDEGWGMLRISKARTGLRGFGDDPDEIGAPKVERSHRDISIPPQLVAELRRYVEAAGIEDGPLFRTRTGGLPDNWGRALKRAKAIVGVRDLSPYDLRRFHGTWLAESGVPYNEAARRMGHSLEVFMRVYVGTTSGVEAVANAAIERALSVAQN